jgi:hypothetical protein
VPALVLCLAAALAAAEGLDQTGNPGLKSAGPLAFGPKGVLFVGDPLGAQVVAIGLPAGETTPIGADFKLEGLNEKLGALLGIPAADVRINDVAVDPATKVAYVSCARGSSPSAEAAIVTVDGKGGLKLLSLDKVPYAKIALANAPAEGAVDKRGRNLRSTAITDLAYVDGKVFIAGMSNEEFASKLRSVAFPFKSADTGTSVEILHTAHGAAIETRSPVQTFVPFNVGGEPQILAAYTCTPLVTFPVKALEPGKKIRGKTVAELGNRNQPLDMITYEKGGKQYLLLSNSARGVMKITTDAIDKQNLTEAVGGGGKAGLSYDTIDALKDVVQLDKLGTDNALVLAGGSLRAVALP